jgi:hypothetical protein
MVLTLNDEHLASWVSGASTPRELFQRGALRIDGAFGPVHQLDFISASFEPQQKGAE